MYLSKGICNMAEKLIHNSAEDVKKYIHGNHGSFCFLDYFICIGYGLWRIENPMHHFGWE